MEDALLSAELQFRNLVDQALVGIYVLDMHGRFLYVNPRLAEISGYAIDELIDSATLHDIVPQINPVEVDEYILKVFEGEAESSQEGLNSIYQARRKDGVTIDIEMQGSQIDFQGKPAIIGTLLETTERKSREREMEAFIAISTALRSVATRSEILKAILTLLIDFFKASAGLIVMRDPITGESVFELGMGLWDAATGVRLHPGEGVSGQVIYTATPYQNNQTLSDPRLARPDLMAGLSCTACVPLIAQQQTIGALWVGRNTAFNENDLRLFTAIGEIAANAIHRATLNEQTELRLQRLTALRAIDMAITASLDARVTLSILLGQVTAQLGIHAASVLLLNPHTQTLEYAASRGFRSSNIQRYRPRLGEGFAGRAAVGRQPVSIPDLNASEDRFVRSYLAGEGFVAYYAMPLIAKGQVKGVLELYQRSPLTPDPEWLDFLQAVSAQAAITIDNAELFDNLQRSNIELTLAYDATIEGWSRALELRDPGSEGHTQELIELTIRLGRAMSIPENELVHIRRGVLLHDIGTMAISNQILFKRGPLTEDEWEIMRRHPTYAYELLSPIPYLRPALDIPYGHHERWDGTGYPRGLKLGQIPLTARIFSVVDVWYALITERPYRAAWSEEKAREYIRSMAGTQFDPEVVDKFFDLLDD